MLKIFGLNLLMLIMRHMKNYVKLWKRFELFNIICKEIYI